MNINSSSSSTVFGTGTIVTNTYDDWLTQIKDDISDNELIRVIMISLGFPFHFVTGEYITKNEDTNTPAVRSNILSKLTFLQAVCDTPVARIAGCVSWI